MLDLSFLREFVFEATVLNGLGSNGVIRDENESGILAERRLCPSLRISDGLILGRGTFYLS